MATTVFTKGDRVQHKMTRQVGTVAREVRNPGDKFGIISVRWDGTEGTMACLPSSLKKVAQNT